MMAAVPHSPGIAAPASTVTIPGVELVSVGTWAASTGMTTVTLEDLQSMMAANRDPGVDRAAIKLGHVDPRFDGEPAMGWAENLRIEQRTPVAPDGKPVPGAGPVPTLVADLVGVPAGLAAIMPTAYRRRSVEIGWQYRTAAGAQYKAALTGLALLGVTPPAVKGLADVMALYAAHQRPPAATGAGSAQSITSLAIDPDLSPGAAAALALTRQQLTALAASGAVPADQVTHWLDALEADMRAAAAVVDHHGTATTIPTGGPRVDEARIRQILGLQAQDDIEAAVARLVAAQPQPPNPAQPPAPAGYPAGMFPAGTVPFPVPPVAPTAPPPGSPPVGAQAAPGTPAAAAPGQPAPATPAAPGAPGTPAGAAQPPNPAPAVPTGQQPATPPPAGAEGFQLPPGMALVSEAVLNELRGGAAAGIAAAQALNEASVDRELTAALSAGKITPAEAGHWRAQLLNPQSAAGTRSLLAAMQPRFSTTATVIGSDALADDPAMAAAASATWEAWEAQVFGIPATTPPPAAVPAAAAFAAPAPPAAPAPALQPSYGYDAVHGYVPLALPPAPRGA